MKARFSEAAAQDLREARAFTLARFGKQARKGLNSEVRRAMALLREHPLAGKPAGTTAREYVVDGYPFSLIYSIEGEEVVIAAVFHHRRHPTVWHDRFNRGR